MKKMIFGVLTTVVGFAFAFFCFIHAAMHPCNYNGIDGLLGAFLGTDLLPAFIIAMLVMLAGLIICGREAYLAEIEQYKLKKQNRA